MGVEEQSYTTFRWYVRCDERVNGGEGRCLNESEWQEDGNTARAWAKLHGWTERAGKYYCPVHREEAKDGRRE